MSKTIIGIILITVISLYYLFILLLVFFWRKSRFVDYIHRTKVSFVFLSLSIITLVLLIVACIFFVNNQGVEIPILALFIILSIVSSIVWICTSCFCIYMEGSRVIKRTLFKQVEIDLNSKETIIENGVGMAYITSFICKNKKITINVKRLEGNIQDLLFKSSIICLEKNRNSHN